ncbi:response regulator transcription factor [Rhizobium rhizogenes]|jgi:DNA-binding response OmpR family regulator|uniref:response regulator n=1 Tax=Rhizobium rhizogenes TaxID=359 RepID=UPI0005601751|nr:response regulator transcription factor [Rhizobium rhizogenes]NTF85368.1 response regulator transcription factor [Rhizobium rhizogenes]NTF89595.1 response regulator transcription factor [Rhizobium rhizogenes]NTG45703.1 response regulator transcription factor [Rhizobium rhizogenes]NTI24888.1 response regulator transcription factor [Rhizobium rhizogenes]NTI78194.1 response regulator transcription factor [Rhizobium rhizogenes]
MRVLLVEDNAKLASLTSEAMRSHGFTVDWVSSANDAEEAISTISYEAVILDLGLPDRDGLSLLEPVRRRAPSTPILILTARDAASSIINALDGGADDYLVKPFVMGVLISRVRALMRRPALRHDTILSERNVHLDLSQHVAKVGEAELQLSRREFAALELFLRRFNRVLSKGDVEESIYGFGEELSSNAVEVLIHRLRKKLQAAGAAIDIHNMRGVGYMLTEGRS